MKRVNRLSLCVLAGLWLVPAAASAQTLTHGDIKTTQRLALENYDLGEYAAARAQLEGLLVKTAEAGLAEDPVSAMTHLILGAALSKLGEADQAIEQFMAALKLDEGILLEPPLNTAKEAALFIKARETLNPVVTCDNLPALAHEIVTTASEGVATEVTVMVGNPLDAGDVVLFYRNEDGGGFRELLMSRTSGCDYAVEIPAEDVKGERIEYYVAAKTKGGKMAAARGSVRAPFVIQVQKTAESPVPEVRDEVPEHLRGGGGKRGGTCAGCSSGGQPGGLAGQLALVLLAALALGRCVRPRRG